MHENEKQTEGIQNEVNAYNAYGQWMLGESLFDCSVYDYFSKEEIHRVLSDPIKYYKEAVELSQLVYNKNGVVSNSIDYCTSLMTLDHIVTSEAKSKKALNNRKLAQAVLKYINDKHFIRDALFSEMLTGVGFYYFDVRDEKFDRKKYMTDYEIDRLTQLNSIGLNVSIKTLPWQYTKIVGTVNGNRYVLAFDLRYFDDYEGGTLEQKLRKYPPEIVKAYNQRKRDKEKGVTTTADWYVLDPDKTMCRKIRSKDHEVWGRSLIISALIDVLYRDYFLDTKRNTLDNINTRVVYETFPENRNGTGSTLNQQQQVEQHNVIKQALQNKQSKNGVAFFSLAAGTKMDTLEVDTDIFDSNNETNLDNNIAVDLGISAALIGAMTTGTYSGNVTNLEMITAQLYSWVCEWKDELVHVINQNIIKDKNNPVDIYYFPTSFVNRKEFFEMMKTLYMNASGSMRFMVASAGVDPDIYESVMQDELDERIYERFTPHQTAYTYSSDSENVGRPEADTPSENTVRSRNNNGNDTPSPSDLS